jgi:hypothetical protein
MKRFSFALETLETEKASHRFLVNHFQWNKLRLRRTIPDYKNYKAIPAGIIPGAQYRANERALK